MAKPFVRQVILRLLGGVTLLSRLSGMVLHRRKVRMSKSQSHIIAFYDRHPISCGQILEKLRATRGGLEGLVPADLFAHDQDHYGGLTANDALAERAGIGAGSLVADFCAGLGGPARYLAHRYGASVVGLELNAGRATGAAALNRLVGLQRKVWMLRADVMYAPLATARADAVISQEALLHIPDKPAALAEAFRVLKGGGRLVFTDWVVHQALETLESAAMWQGIGAQSLQRLQDYDALLRRAGFEVLAVEDLTADWAGILAERFAMYRRLRQETLDAGLPSGDEAFYQAYARLVASVQAGTLGGGRFTAVKP